MDDLDQESQDWFAANAPQPDNTRPKPGSGAAAGTQSGPGYDWFAANAPPAVRGPAAATSWREDLENDLWGSGGAEAASQPVGRPNGAPGSSTRGGNAGSGMKPETARFLRDLAGIGTPAYLDMRSPQAPAFEDWRDRNFDADGSGNYVSHGGLPYTEDELEQMHGLLSRQAGNPLISGLFKGPKSTLADYMVWRNQNFAGNQGTWQDEDGTLYSGPALEELFSAKSQAQPRSAGAPASAPGPGGSSQQQTPASSGTSKSVGTSKQPAMRTALPKELIDQQRRQQLINLMTGLQDPATRPLGVAQDGSLIVDVGPPRPTARPVSPPTIGSTAKQRDQLSALMSGIGSRGATPYGVGADGSTILDVGRQVRVPSRIAQQSPVAPPQLQEDPAVERRTMSRLLRDLRQPSNTPMGETPGGLPMLDLTSQVKAPSRVPRQYDSGDFFSNVDIGRIKGHEGGTLLHANVPPPDKKGRWNSGVTVAAGYDLGQHTISDLRKFGLSQDVIDRFTPYLGLKGQEAQDALDKHPLEISVSEARKINEGAFRSYPDSTGQAFNEERAEIAGHRNRNNLGLDPRGHPAEFARLPWQAQTAIADLWYNLGDLRDKAPNLWEQVTTGDWEGAYQNLLHFSSGDDALARRARSDAGLLRQAIDTGAMPDY